MKTRKLSIGKAPGGPRTPFMALLVMVQDVLADRYEFKGVVSRNKGNASRPCPEKILNELSEQCDVVITASGD